MCGILGIVNHEQAVSLTLKSANQILHRGKDSYGLFTGLKVHHASDVSELPNEETESHMALFHNLHSVVSVVEQPLFDSVNYFASNCEIYNWKELKQKYKIICDNDAQALYKLLKIKGQDVLNEIDGDYAFTFGTKNELIAARDLVGVNPLWYYHDGFLILSSEKKAIRALGYEPIELNPREVLHYNLQSRELILSEREFYQPRHVDSEYLNVLDELFVKAVEKRIPDKKLGILFSGGIDSTMLALACKKLGKEVTLYTTAYHDDLVQISEDYVMAQKAADFLGLPLKKLQVSLEDVEKHIKTVIQVIESKDVTKVGVALPFYFALEIAAQDDVKVIFSGLGSEELFAGYQRHQVCLVEGHDVNEECVKGLLGLHDRDLYRDNVICMHNTIELRLPFLDKELIELSMSIPQQLKISETDKKIILRQLGEQWGLPAELFARKKLGAQYGSNFDKSLLKLAKKHGFKYKKEYLESL